MKVLSIFGGPRMKGNTVTVLSWVEEELKNLGHEIERVNIVDKNVQGCIGCMSCQEFPDEPGCVQEDDALPIFEKMIHSDAVLYSCPLYCWSFPAQLKLLIDRHFCLVTGYNAGKPKSLIQGCRTALLVTCAGPIENNADLITESFHRFSDYLLTKPIGELIVPFCTTPEALGEEIQSQALKFARHASPGLGKITI